MKGNSSKRAESKFKMLRSCSFLTLTFPTSISTNIWKETFPGKRAKLLIINRIFHEIFFSLYLLHVIFCLPLCTCAACHAGTFQRQNYTCDYIASNTEIASNTMFEAISVNSLKHIKNNIKQDNTIRQISFKYQKAIQ